MTRAIWEGENGYVRASDAAHGNRLQADNEILIDTLNRLEYWRGNLEAARLRLEGLQDEKLANDAGLTLHTLKTAGSYASFYLSYAAPIGRAPKMLIDIKNQLGTGANAKSLYDQLVTTIRDPSAENLN